MGCVGKVFVMSTDMTELLKRVLRHLKRHNIGEWHGPSWDSEQVALVALLEGMMADTTAEPYGDYYCGITAAEVKDGRKES